LASYKTNGRFKDQEKDIKASKDFLIIKIEDHQVNIEN